MLNINNAQALAETVRDMGAYVTLLGESRSAYTDDIFAAGKNASMALAYLQREDVTETGEKEAIFNDLYQATRDMFDYIVDRHSRGLMIDPAEVNHYRGLTDTFRAELLVDILEPTR